MEKKENGLRFTFPGPDSSAKISRQVTESYRSAYRGLMTDKYLNSMPDDYWVERLSDSFSRGDICMTVEKDGRIVGTAVFGEARTYLRKNTAELYAIYLSPEYVGCGIGHKLYCEIERVMRERGYRQCVLEVLTGNRRAVEFYLSHGFTSKGVFVVEENGMMLPCCTMEKTIEGACPQTRA